MASPPPNPGRFSVKIPASDNRERRVCDQCGFIDYANPKVVVGSVASWDGRILLCRRAIEPRSGLWTLPAGYLEEHETPEEGAQRKAWEEARAELEILALLGVYSIPRISQVQLIYKARLRSSDVAAGEESLEVGLVAALYAPTIKLLVVCWMGCGVLTTCAVLFLRLTLRTGVAVEINDDGGAAEELSVPGLQVGHGASDRTERTAAEPLERSALARTL